MENNVIKLNAIEKIFYYSSLEGDENVIAIAVVERDVGVEITKNVFRQALNYMYERHPLLRAHLCAQQPSDMYIVLSDDRNLNLEIEWAKLDSGESLMNELEEFNLKIFDYLNGSLLWRFKIFEYEQDGTNKLVLTIVVPHFITDGINISVILMEIINIANSILTVKECEEMRVKFEITDDLLKLVEKSGLLNKGNDPTPNDASQADERFSFKFDEKLQSPDDSGLKINMLALDRETSLSIMEHAKSKKIKLNGFLLAVMLYALKKLYDENGLTLQDSFSLYIPVNLRMRLATKVDFGQLRMLITLVQIHLKYPNFGKYENLWNDASHINELIQEEIRIDNGALFKTLDGLEEYVNIFENPRINETFEEKIDIGLSNVGTYLNEKKMFGGPLNLVEIYHGDSLSKYPNFLASLILHATTWNDRFMFQMSTNRRGLNAKYADRFLQLFKEILINSF